MHRTQHARLRHLMSVLFLITVCGPAARAAPTVPATFTAQVQPAAARRGETIVLTVKAAIKAPWHVYSVLPVPPPGPVETSLTIPAGPLRPVGKIGESVPKRMNDPNFGKEVAYHEGTATFTQRLEIPKNAAVNPKLPVVVTVRYMACNDTQCLPPREVVVKTTLAIEAGAARPQFIGAATETRLPPEQVISIKETIILPAGGAAASESLVPFLLTAFGAGLLALITPCVFPMIPITLAFFTKQATAKDGNGAASQAAVVRLAATYSLGIVIAFTAIGAVLAATVGAAGPNRIAANPWVNLAFATLFILFALALLEVVELRPPAALQGLAGTGGRRGGTLGVLFMGLTFVVAAFTCTAPFIGTVLVAAAGASTGAQWLRPILGMAAFALALALPFFLLSLFPGWLARMPRSGAWLSTVKGVMGFIELGAALKFLSNADIVWGWKLLPAPVLLALWAVTALAAALWLLGILRVGFGTPEGRPTPARGAWAVAFGALCLYFLWGLTGRPLNATVASLLPPDDYGVAPRAAGGERLVWHDTLEAGLTQARNENRPLFIDFTGYACTNCRLMEKDVFPVPDVHAELERFVRVRLYTDGTDAASKRNQRYQEKTFGDVALPLYAVLSPDGKPITQVAGINPAAKFTGFLRAAHDRAGRTALAQE